MNLRPRKDLGSSSTTSIKRKKDPTAKTLKAKEAKAKAAAPRAPTITATPDHAHPSNDQNDASIWRSIRPIPEGSKIHKGTAKNKYHLRISDFEGLPFVEKKTVVQGVLQTAHVYDEKDVERKALDRFGGEEGFGKQLAKCSKLWQKRNARKPGKAFQYPDNWAPRGGFPSAPTVSITRFPVKDNDPVLAAMQNDTNVHTEKLLRMKNQLVRDGQEWLWHALNRRYWDVEVPPGTDCGRDVDLDTGSTHEKVVLAATTSLLRKVQYPPRPSHVIASSDNQFSSSTSFATFNEIIARAPVYNFRVDDRREGLVISGGSLPDFDDEEADWDAAYYLEVHTALLAIAREHGREGWNKARWLVYDKYCDCNIGGLRFTETSNRTIWTDTAAFWLDAHRYKMNEPMISRFINLLDSAD